VCGALALGSLSDRFGRRRIFELAALSVGLVAAVYWMAPTLWLAAMLLALLGATYLALLTSASTSIQARVPSRLRGRVASLYSMVVNGAYALGLIAQGALGDRIGLRTVMVGSALLYTCGLASARALRPTLFAELDGALTGSDPLPTHLEVV
jgi:MFS family permease